VTDAATRLAAARRRARETGVDAILVTPGPDLRYLTGYDAIPLERLTCLVVPADGDPSIVVPRLEQPAALASPIGEIGLPVHTWEETEDPYALVGRLLDGATTVALDDRMWAVRVLALRAALPGAAQLPAGPLLRELRMRKAPAEVEALRAAGAAIDVVHTEVPRWLRPGRTEAEVGHDIADAIVASGHARVDFVIVAGGPNGASPHHEVSDRELQAGELVVVDIGGTMPSGYCSDSTRTYALGAPDAEALAAYAVLQAAQEAACDWARPGVSCASVDAAARDVIDAAGLGDLFVHRTGHGIGLETHEDPYIVAGNELPLEPGMAFSIEPGVYQAGRFGARIEDIVVCTGDGAERLNRTPRDLVVVEA
jgi:Xaa-Pro aminopeptidase